MKLVGIPQELIRSDDWRGMKPGAVKLLMTLVGYAQDAAKTVKWRGSEYALLPGELITDHTGLGSACGVSGATARKVLGELEDAGLIEVAPVHQGVHVYVSCCVGDVTQHKVPERVPEGARPEKVKKVNHLSDYDGEIPHQFTGEKTKKAIEDWITYKVNRKEAYTPISFKAFLTTQSRKFKRGEDFHHAIYESIGSQWRGVHDSYGGYNAK